MIGKVIRKKIYLDNNATTQILPEVRSSITETLNLGPLNPSSPHSMGSSANKILHDNRSKVAALVQAKSESILFTSGGTESNNIVLNSIFQNYNTARIITSEVEHSSILKACNFLRSLGADITLLPVDSMGRIDLDQLNDEITPNTNLVSIQWINNETGVKQDIEKISRICQKNSVRFHCDAAQAIGKFDVDIGQYPIDYLSFSAHKFHGPVGIGALYFSNKNELVPLFHGGQQEYNLRPGTENLIGIVGMGKASEIRKSKLFKAIDYMQSLKDTFELLLMQEVDGIHINGGEADRTCNTSNILFEGVDGQALMSQLDSKGIQCSQGSACTSMLPTPSHVLLAMGLSEEQAYSSIRFSFSELNTRDDVSIAVDIISECYKALRKYIGTKSLRNG